MTVHVLHYGLPLCQFSVNPPCEWPRGHKWVGVEDAKELATCEQCKRRALAIQTVRI